MSVWYSDLFGTDGDNDTSLPAVTKIIDAGRSHGRKRVKRAYFKGMPLNTEVVRMMRMRSGDRLYSLEWISDGAGTVTVADVGIYLAGSNHDGAVVDVDLFGSAVDFTTAADITDVFDESTNLTPMDRGKYLWQLADLGAATLTVDPQVEYEICLTATASWTVADNSLLLIAEYTSGD